MHTCLPLHTWTSTTRYHHIALDHMVRSRVLVLVGWAFPLSILTPRTMLPLPVLAGGGDEKKERENPVSSVALSTSWSLSTFSSSSLPQLERDLFILLSRRGPISNVSSRSRGSWLFSSSRSSRIWLSVDRSFWYDEHPWRIEAPVTDWARVLRNGSASAADE